MQCLTSIPKVCLSLHLEILVPRDTLQTTTDTREPGSQVIATLTAAEVPPAANPGFLGIDNGMDHNYYLQLAGRYAVQFSEL